MAKKALLVILDGYGIAENKGVSAIDRASKPYLDHLFATYPHAQLTASGEAVGLPDGQFGNSEVGHLNIGSGRIVWQELSRIDKDIRDGTFFTNPILVEAVKKATERGRIHLMGLFSDGGVHSHNKHLYALLKLCKKAKLQDVFVHAFTDGRDTTPDGGLKYVQEFNAQAKLIGTGRIASVIGRYYAMDRDKRWERVELAYRLLTEGVGTQFQDAEAAFLSSYKDGITDEFIKPCIIGNDNNRIQPNDTVIFFNFRGDRAREISSALNDPKFNGFSTKPLNLNYYTFTQYDITFNWAHVAYSPVFIKNTLGEVISSKGLRQLRIAETEKYPHVTYFFNGGVEEPNTGEDRIMVPSPKVATYDLQPEMSAAVVTAKLTEALSRDLYDLVILNYANPDMVGHTGVMEAAVKAIETIDNCMKDIVTTALKHHYEIVIIADHGNSDCMIQPDGSPHTAHTTAPVPVLIISSNPANKPSDGILADVAPTLLKLMGIPLPVEMTGKSLV